MTPDARRRGAAMVAAVALATTAVTAQSRPTTTVTWRLLENHTESGGLAARVEVVARGPSGAEQRVGPFSWPCGVSYAEARLQCVYGSAYDDLRVRRRGAWCVLEAQRSTEHGTQRPRALGRVRCAGDVTVWFDDVARALPRQRVATP